MNAHGDIPVLMPRESWESILAALNSAKAPTPLARRLQHAVDAALNARIEAAVDEFMQSSEGE